jgi:hypothetical protein
MHTLVSILGGLMLIAVYVVLIGSFLLFGWLRRGQAPVLRSALRRHLTAWLLLAAIWLGMTLGQPDRNMLDGVAILLLTLPVPGVLAWMAIRRLRR